MKISIERKSLSSIRQKMKKAQPKKKVDSEAPLSYKKAIAELFSDIEEMKKRGMTYKEVHQFLSENGLKGSYPSFTAALLVAKKSTENSKESE